MSIKSENNTKILPHQIRKSLTFENISNKNMSNEDIKWLPFDKIPCEPNIPSKKQDLLNYQDLIYSDIDTIITPDLCILQEMTKKYVGEKFMYKICQDHNGNKYLAIIEIPNTAKSYMWADDYISNQYATYNVEYGLVKQIIDIKNMKNIKKMTHYVYTKDSDNVVIYEVDRYIISNEFVKPYEHNYSEFNNMYYKSMKKAYFGSMEIPENFSGIWINFGYQNKTYELISCFNGKKHGRSILFKYVDNIKKFGIARIGYYVQNKKDGEWLFWHLSNNDNIFVRHSQYYINDLLHGEEKIFDSNGNILKYGKYENGNKIGKHFDNRDGLYQIMVYENDEIIVHYIKHNKDEEAWAELLKNGENYIIHNTLIKKGFVSSSYCYYDDYKKLKEVHEYKQFRLANIIVYNAECTKQIITEYVYDDEGNFVDTKVKVLHYVI
jgi:hypothetical protein